MSPNIQATPTYSEHPSQVPSQQRIWHWVPIGKLPTKGMPHQHIGVPL